jgi:hypothetical protein
MKALMIGALCLCMAAPPAQAAGFDTGIQIELYLLGFYQGKLDGSFGPASQKALRDYQADRGLPVTGQVDAATRDKLIAWEMVQGRAREIAMTDAMKDAAATSVKEDLIDPYSAVFDYEAAYVNKSKTFGSITSICGKVNAKNRFGAYVGRTYFVATLMGDDDHYQAFSLMDKPDAHPLAAIMCLLRLDISSGD